MNTRLFLIAPLLFAFAAAQYEDKISIDQFTEEQGPFVWVTTSTSASGCQYAESVSGPEYDILGGERYLFYTVENITDCSCVFSCGVYDEVLTAATPNVNQGGILGFLGVQWDGSNEISLDPSGLGGVDLTANLADRFHISGRADFSIEIELRIYSGHVTDYCVGNFTIPAGHTYSDIFLLFDDFYNIGIGCSFADVGAIQLKLDLVENLDIDIGYVRTYGPYTTTMSSVNIYEFYTEQGQPIGLGQSSRPISLGSNLSPNVTVSGLDLETNTSAQISVYTYGTVYTCDITNVDGTQLKLSVTFSDNEEFSTDGNITEAGSLCWPADPDGDLVCFTYSH